MLSCMVPNAYVAFLLAHAHFQAVPRGDKAQAEVTTTVHKLGLLSLVNVELKILLGPRLAPTRTANCLL